METCFSYTPHDPLRFFFEAQISGHSFGVTLARFPNCSDHVTGHADSTWGWAIEKTRSFYISSALVQYPRSSHIMH